MAGDASAYAALGLEPGADSSAIEQAYKRLIKQHHPDRDGGNPGKAAEINRAYRDLRATRNLKDPLELNEELALPRRDSHAWLALAILLAAAIVALLLSEGRFGLLPGNFAAPALPKLSGGQATPVTAKRPPARDDPMDRALHVSVIDASVKEALHLARTGDEMALASLSGDCHRTLRSAPSLTQLDRCAAFDDAVVELQDRDPLRDQGPFSEIAVTGRVWSGATALSDDSVAIDGRLDRIRLRVELALAAAVQPEAPVANGN
jgi:curved DNA-binding protein CbpA